MEIGASLALQIFHYGNQGPADFVFNAPSLYSLDKMRKYLIAFTQMQPTSRVIYTDRVIYLKLTGCNAENGALEANT